jgi:nicotinamidase-related amidase
VGDRLPVDLTALANPGHTAVLTMEMQRGVIGDLSPLPELAGAVAALDVVGRTATLLHGARGAGVRVVHCTVEMRADRAGSADNAPLLAASAKDHGHLVAGTPSAALVPGLEPAESDVVSARLHGLSPFGGTSLEVILRNLGVSTVVATGVSLNLGVLGLAIEGVNLGFRVIVATDAVCGFPPEYAQAVLRHSMRMVAVLATVDDLLAAWR